ncbi:cation/H(+) antiporter 14-like [Juglans microcarpa x Juglans regia]|uniref:cation/H(+) antiporter 14-like n=1 Tax=Juglans microcarpa x Juglans regia TaxID=2249226 RepID=UPI001B7EB091|nr:cation/H(+) antiporter 14-like [Juglans microcarpa x Juglans regia]
MSNSNGPERTFGVVLGETLVCQHTHMVDSRGLLLGNNPFNYSTPLLLIQFALIFIITWSTYLLLRPLRQTMIISQIVGGIIMGPSLLARSSTYAETMFPPGCRLLLSTFAELGFMLHLFVLGVQIDICLLKRIGKKAMAIGITGFLAALAFGGLAIKLVQLITSFKQEVGPEVSIMVAMNSVTSFIVTTSLLNELNILNSEIGRLASSTSMVSDVCGWCTAFFLAYVVNALQSSSFKPMLTVAMMLGYYCILIFLLRPLVIWIVNLTPSGRPIKESHFIAILCILLGNGFIAEYVGQHAGFGSFLFGLSLPGEPPLGALLLQKLGTICSGTLLPVYCTISGFRTEISALDRSSAGMVIIILAGYIGKFTGTILSSIYFEIPFQDSLSLALIMCCKGVIELAIYSLWKDTKFVDRKTFTTLVITMVIMTGFATPIIRYLYDPSKRYMGQKRITIMSNSRQHQCLRVLVCIHNEDNVFPIINLIEASNPTKDNIISVSVLQLMELTGRAASVLIRHTEQPNHSSSKLACSEQIANAFNQYERYSHGRVAVQHFTAIAPYSSMHDDICTLALEEKTSIIIVPFHKKWELDGTVEAAFPFIRIINRQVIRKSPCSVGVLVDRSHGGRSVLTVTSSYRIAMLFLGGADDGEALEYSMRMAQHPNVSLTVVWFRPEKFHPYGSRTNPDSTTRMMSELRARIVGVDKITYKEVRVKDGADTTHIIRVMEDSLDLVILGSHHVPECAATLGLTEWSECPELGILGDMLATSDFQFSVLVVQHYQEG